MNTRAVLERVSAFETVDNDGFERLERIGAEVHFPRGSAILREGECGEAFFVVVSGTLEIQVDDFAESPHRVARLGPGAVFGEGAALTGEPRSATVMAVDHVVALRFEMVSVFGVLKDYPAALEALRRLAVTRAEDLVEAINED